MRSSEEAHNRFELLVASALGVAPLITQEQDDATRPVTPAVLTKITAFMRDTIVRPWEQRMTLAELGGVHAEELEDALQRRDFDAQEMGAILRDRKASDDPRLPDVEHSAAALIRQERLDAPPGSPVRAFVVRAVRDGLLAGHNDVDDILSGKRRALPNRPRIRTSTAPRLSDVVADYTGQLRAERTIREANGALASFVAIIGDMPLDELTRQDFIAFCRAEGARTVGGKASDSVARPISPETLKKKIGLLRAAINLAIQTDRVPGPNPAANIDATKFTKPVSAAVMPAKRGFDVHELTLILQHPWFTGCESQSKIHEAGSHRLSGAHYWAPVLAMHTGCRAGELGGLRIAEIRLDHQHPHIVIRDNVYRTTKGSYTRRVPILDVLLEHGFGDFVERQATAGHDRLFADWEPPAGKVDANATAWSNGRIIRSFNRTVVRQQLGAILVSGARQEVTFHGFRGAFKTLLTRIEYGLNPNYIHEVVGHAKLGLDQRYIGEIPIADTYPAMHGCRYNGLQLPPAPS